MANHRFLQAAVLALPLTIGMLAGASAQSRPDPAQRPEPAPETVPGNPAVVPPEKIAPPDTRADGTITPPKGVDPGMAMQPPDPGPRSMTVLPPPGSPGGNPAVIPK